jgi:vitamin B12/bleomycin/antimicrobial peptide transport system ATP-binding/permease protein
MIRKLFRWGRTPRRSRKTGRPVIRQFLDILAPFLQSNQRAKAYGLFVLLLLLSFSVSGVAVLMSYISRDFTTALSEKKAGEFYYYCGLYLAALLLAVPIAVLYRYCEERLVLLWRGWFSDYLIKKYLGQRRYYRLRWNAEIDNPDQRISEDLRNFTSTSISFVLIILNSTVTLFAFAGVLYTLSPLLTIILLLYAFFGSLFSIIIGKRLIRLQRRQLKREASFRYSIIRIRDNAESIAFYRGESRESADIIGKLSALIRNTVLVIGWNRNLAFFTTGYHFLSLLIPTVVVAPRVLRGEVDFGAITQAASAFAQILAAVSLIVTQFERISQFAAGMTRLGEFWDALHEEERAPVAAKLRSHTTDALALRKVKVETPDKKRTLLDDLDLRIEPGQSLLIMGESGSGKSSLLRLIAGLWTSGEGDIQRPELAEIMFLPQRPYMVPGTLRAQVMYPGREKMGRDRVVEEIISKVNLGRLLDSKVGLNRILDWGNVLSLGEQQRLSFGRFLFANSKMAFLDEATSALDDDNEALIYDLLRQTGKTYISVGHRQSLRKYHDHILEVEPEGNWRFGRLVNGEVQPISSTTF